MATSRQHAWLCLVHVGCAASLSEAPPDKQVAEIVPDGTTTPAEDSGEDTAPPVEDPSSPCGLSVQSDRQFYLEGDTVAFVVSCADGDVAEAATSLGGAPPAGEFDPSTGAFRWQTDGASGGRYDITVGVSGGGVLESEVVTFWVADDPDAAGAQAPRPGEYTEEWGLPVIHVTVDGSPTEEERAATITVRDQAVDGFVKIRGASSASYPKVSYTLDFESDELSVTEWGEQSREHMILITSFDDNSYLRQKLGYDLWMAMAEHQGVQRLTPRTFFGVLYLNGEYQGLYTGCDRIDDEFLRHMGTEGDGNLYKSVSHDANFYLVDASGRTKSWLGAGYEKKEGDPENWDDLYALVSLTGESDDDTLWNHHPGVDLEEFADWLIWAQFTLAQDSAGKNAYLYADPIAEQWRLTPWDLNESFGQNWYTARLPATNRNDYFWNNRVFAMLQTQPDARAMVEARYAELRANGPLQPEVLHAMIDTYVDTLGPNMDRDWDRWGDRYRSYDRWAGTRNAAGDWTTPEEEVAYIRAWIDARVAMYDADGPF